MIARVRLIAMGNVKAKVFEVGETHPKFNLLAFSGYDAETGEECWASIAIEGSGAAFAAFRENKRLRLPNNHPTCGNQSDDNQPASAHPTSHP
jgi:hypothetical protein